MERKPLIGGAEGDRTLDLRIANATLSQLSYRPMRPPREITLAENGNHRPAPKMRDFAGTRSRRAILASRAGTSNERRPPSWRTRL